MSSEYWNIVVNEILGEAGISFNESQLSQMAKDFERASEMQSESTGEMYISHNPEAIELEKLKAEQAAKDKWFHSTTPCKPCYQTGVVKDRWNRDITCPHCDGKSRVNRGYWN